MVRGRFLGLVSFGLVSLLGGSALADQPVVNFSDWEAPVHLGADVNSAGNDFFAAISPDGRSLYFTSDRAGGLGGEDIWLSQRANECDPWPAAVPLGGVVNGSFQDRSPSLSRDGHWLYFSSQRPGGCGVGATGDLYVSYRSDTCDDFDWEAPVNLGCVVNSTASEAGPVEDISTGYVQLYFMSNRAGGLGNFDIWMSDQLADGSFGPATNVTVLNRPQADTRPYALYNGREMYIGSTRPGGLGADDLYVSRRENPGDPWGTPVNVTVLNGSGADTGAALSYDGTTMVFDSTRAGGLGGRDLYVTERRRLINGQGNANGRDECHRQGDGNAYGLCYGTDN